MKAADNGLPPPRDERRLANVEEKALRSWRV
jgi:hypothetical protein